MPPVLLVLKFTVEVAAPLQTTWLAGLLTWAVGFTVIVNVLAEPAQFVPPFRYDGVTVIFAVTGVDPVFTAVNGVIFPVPPAPSPMAVLSLVQV